MQGKQAICDDAGTSARPLFFSALPPNAGATAWTRSANIDTLRPWRFVRRMTPIDTIIGQQDVGRI